MSVYSKPAHARRSLDSGPYFLLSTTHDHTLLPYVHDTTLSVDLDIQSSIILIDDAHRDL